MKWGDAEGRGAVSPLPTKGTLPMTQPSIPSAPKTLDDIHAQLKEIDSTLYELQKRLNIIIFFFIIVPAIGACYVLFSL